MTRRVGLIDTTLRDGNQSIWAVRCVSGTTEFLQSPYVNDLFDLRFSGSGGGGGSQSGGRSGGGGGSSGGGSAGFG